ncbi:hypothetical protein D3C72_1769230 [compost metagenome]
MRQACLVRVAIEARDAGDEAAAHARFGRQHLVPFQAHDFIDLFHGKRLCRAGKFGHHQDLQAAALAADRHRQVDHGHDLATDIDHAQHVRVRTGHGRDGRHFHDFTDFEHIDAEQFAAGRVITGTELEQEQFEFVIACQAGAFIDILLH